MYRFVTYAAFVTIFAVVGVMGIRTTLYGPSKAQRPPAAAKIVIDPALAARNLSQALRVRTVSHSRGLPPEADAFAEFHDFLLTRFPLVHQTMSREKVSEYSLLYTWQGSDPALDPILFSAHMDVVPVEPGTESDWDYPAFSGQIADGYVWGRGSLDMKQSLTGYMQAAEALLAQGFAPERTIFFAFTHDEELGAGAAREIATLLETRGVSLLFTLDEGLVVTDGLIPGVSKPVALLGIAQKGYVTVELVARGPGGHSSMPAADPVNARLTRAVLKVFENPTPARLVPPVSGMFEDLAPELGLLNRVILANRWLFGPVLMSRLDASPATSALIRTTFAPTVLESGFKPNVLPQQGRAVFSIRILPDESVEGTILHIREQIDDPEVEVNIIGNEPSEPSRVSDTGAPSFQLLRQTVHQVFPDVVSAPGLLVGRTDSRRYARIAKSSYLFLPSRLAKDDLPRLHGTNERIAIENYLEIVRFYAQLILNTAVDFEPRRP